jgi:HD superfamily phosphohydrolase YqeK
MSGAWTPGGSAANIYEGFHALAAKLLAATQSMQIYPARHPSVEKGIDDLISQLSAQLEARGKIQLAVTGTEFLVGETQIPIEGELLEETSSLLRASGIQKLEFFPGLGRSEVTRLLELLLLSPDQLWAMGGLSAVLAAEGISNIAVGTIKLGDGLTTDPESLFRTLEAYRTGLKLVQSIRGRVRNDGQLANIEEAKEFARELVELAVKETRPLLAVQALKSHDEYSYTHSVNVAMITVAIAASIGVSQESLHEIGLAALLHDVGKELIPLEILLKPGKLDDDEWVIVNRHGRDGARILAATEGIGDLPPIVSFEHHLAYHDELRTDPHWRPHLASAIVCIADVYDALRSERPYRAGMGPEESMKIMQDDVGRLFDPDLFEGFFRMMGYYPPGTTVELADGTVAIVHSANLDHPILPQVLAVRSAAGEPIVPPERLDLSLAGPEKRISGLAMPDQLGLRPVEYL